jgi:hypothetical protein
MKLTGENGDFRHYEKSDEYCTVLAVLVEEITDSDT